MDRPPPQSSNVEDLLAQQKQSVQARVSQLGQAYLAQASEALKRSWESSVASEMERKLEEALQTLEQEFDRRIALRQAELRAQSLLQADEVRTRTQRESSEVLARLARQMDEAEDLGDWKAALLDAVHAQSRTVLMLSVSGGRVMYEGHRTEEPSAEGESWESLQTSLDQAAAISAACTSMETVVCLASERELSHAIYAALKPVENQRVFLVPVLTGRAQGRRRTAALLLLEPRSGETPDTGWLEAIAILAGALHECRLLAGSKNAGAPEMLGIAPAAAASVAAGTEAAPPNSPATPGTKSASKPEEREVHQKAQRFARVKVAEIRLYQSQQVIQGRAKKELFSAIREPLMKAREEYSEQFLSFEGMPDYLHMEAMQTLANGDASAMGADYPGPLV